MLGRSAFVTGLAGGADQARYLAVNWEALPSDVGRLIHAHPSLSEAIGETMITFSGRSLHG